MNFDVMIFYPAVKLWTARGFIFILLDVLLCFFPVCCGSVCAAAVIIRAETEPQNREHIHHALSLSLSVCLCV